MTDFLFSLSQPVEGSTIDVLQVGSYDSTRYGKFDITHGDLQEYIREFRESNAAGRRQVDFDHKGSQGDTRAAGWIQDLHVEGDKLKAKVEWTPAGRAAVEGKEYRFTSAEYSSSVRSKTTGKTEKKPTLKAVTLTNRPFIDTMDPVSLSDDPHARLAVYPTTLEVEDDGGVELSTGTIGGTKISNLPKSSYAWVDGEGIGHLPYKDGAGKVDAAHTRNALARLNQVKTMSDDDRATARRKLEAALRSVGGSPSGDNTNKTRKHMSDLHTLLKLSEDADDATVLDAVKALVEKPAEPAEGTVTLAEFTALSERTRATEQTYKDLLRDTYLSEAVRSGRVAPSELVADKGEPALITIFNASPEAAKAMIEARPVNKMLSEVGGSEGATVSGERKLTTDDIFTTRGTEGSREQLHARALQLMADKATNDYGEALVLAEREALA